jgi:hypothetical protein
MLTFIEIPMVTEQIDKKAKIFNQAEIDATINAKNELLGLAIKFVEFMEKNINWDSVQVKEKLLELGFLNKQIFHFFIAGGYPAHLLNGTGANGIDIYFTSENHVKFWSWLCENVKEHGPKSFLVNSDFIVSEQTNDYDKVKVRLSSNNQSHNVSVSQNAISITSPDLEIKYQLITCFFGSPKLVINTFDMLHCKCYLEYSEMWIAPGQLYISREIFDAIKQKKMFFSDAVPATPLRVKKYFDKGYDFGEKYMFYPEYAIAPAISSQTKRLAIDAAVKKFINEGKNNV